MSFDRAAGTTRRQFLRTGILAAVSVSAACTPGHTEIDQTSDVTGTWNLVGGVPQGVYQAWATAFATSFGKDHPGARIAVRSTGGSRMNIDLLRDGDVDLALAAADSCADDRTTGGQPAGAGLMALARLYDDYMHLIVPANSKVRELDQLHGRRMVCGAVGSGTSLIAARVLAAAHVRDVQRLNTRLVQGLDRLAAREVDAVFWSGGLPTAAVSAAWERQDLRLIPLDTVGAVLREQFSGIYRTAVIPAGTYPTSPPIPTFTVSNLLLCRPVLAPRTMRAVLTTLFDDESAIAHAVPAFSGFDAETAIDTEPVAMAPGAVSYLRSLKP